MSEVTSVAKAVAHFFGGWGRINPAVPVELKDPQRATANLRQGERNRAQRGGGREEEGQCRKRGAFF